MALAHAPVVPQLPLDTILCGHALAVLRTLPDNSVHTCVTSPPYWGQRAYGTYAQVWDGDDDCAHDWVAQRYYREGGNSTSSRLAFSQPGPDNAQRLKETRWHEDAFCARCGAWQGELGAEPTPDLYVGHLVSIFREVRRVLRPDGTLWLNLGDSYAAGGGSGHQRLDQLGARLGTGGGKKHTAQPCFRAPTPAGLKHKDLIGIPWRVAFALQEDGWWLRMDVVWEKKNCKPESVTDRPTKSHEYVFLLAKSARYFCDMRAIREPIADKTAARYRYPFGGKKNEHLKATDDPTAPVGMRTAPLTRNKRSVWHIATRPFAGAHFATMPVELAETCLLAGAPSGGVVLDPFLGSGTVGVAARAHSRHYIGIELNPTYVPLAQARIASVQQPLLWSAQ